MDPWCAETSRERAEPLVATASRVERWLLVEHTGAWGPESVPSGRMPLEAARALARTAADAGARLLLLRRPQGVPCGPGRWVYAVDSRPGSEVVRARQVGDDAELEHLAPPYAGPAEGWTVVDEPLLLVCTHGRHDRCCALRGRPVAAALAARHPSTTWECSHVGGDRFAANLLVLPDGLYFGRVEADEVLALADALADGELAVDRLRGRSSLSMPAQAAQHFARARLGRSRREDLAVTGQQGAGADRWRVHLAGTPGRPAVQVVVRYDRSGDGAAQVLTCGAGEAKRAPVFRLVELVVDGPAGDGAAAAQASASPAVSSTA